MSIATTALRVAAGQAAAAPGDLDANLRTTARLAALAGDQGVRVLVLPEAFLTGSDAAVFAGALPGPADLPVLPIYLLGANPSTPSKN